MSSGSELPLPNNRTILSLCDYTGTWSKPYKDAGYNVIQVDMQRGGEDVRLMKLPLEPIHGVLAAPPCTVFALSGNRWKRTDQEMIDGISVVDACVRIAAAVKPKWWVLENPVGKLKHWMGKPTMYFQPCDYGDPYTKRTALWGDFNTDLAQTPTEPTEGSKMWAMYGGKSMRTKNARSATPTGFARAFFEANP